MEWFALGFIVGLLVGFCIVMAFHDYDPKTNRLTWRSRND